MMNEIWKQKAQDFFHYYQRYLLDFYWFLTKKKIKNLNFHEKDVSLANKYFLQENAASSSSLLHS